MYEINLLKFISYIRFLYGDLASFGHVKNFILIEEILRRLYNFLEKLETFFGKLDKSWSKWDKVWQKSYKLNSFWVILKKIRNIRWDYEKN